jgi:hypothetical protein
MTLRSTNDITISVHNAGRPRLTSLLVLACVLTATGLLALTSAQAEEPNAKFIRWQQTDADAWTQDDQGVWRAAKPNAVLTGDPAPDNFNMRMRFRVNNQDLAATLQVRFRMSNGHGYALILDACESYWFWRSLGLFEINGDEPKLIGEMPAAIPDYLGDLYPESPAPVGKLEADTWYEVRLQVQDNRIGARLWKADQPEPTYWLLDFVDESYTQGDLELLGSPGTEVTATRLEEPTPFPVVPDTDLRTVRFSRRTWTPTDFNYEQDDTEIKVSGDLAQMIFDRSRASVRHVRIRNETFDVTCFPDIRYVTGVQTGPILFSQDPGWGKFNTVDGEEFRQSYGGPAELHVTGWDGKYLVLEGSCQPANELGVPGPAQFDLKYRIHRDLGIVLFEARCRQWKLPVKRFEFVNSLKDSPAQQLDYVNCGVVGHNELVIKDRWGQPRNSLVAGPVDRADGVVTGDQFCYGQWSSGRFAFQVQPMSFGGHYISPAPVPEGQERQQLITVQGITYVEPNRSGGMRADPGAEKYLVAQTKNGQRHLDTVFINTIPSDPAVVIGAQTFSTAFQFLPFRKYQPNAWLLANAPHYSGTTKISSDSILADLAHQLAELGVDGFNVGTGDLNVSAFAKERDEDKSLHWHQTRQTFASLSNAGLRGVPAWWSGSWDLTQFDKAGWLEAKDVPAAWIVNPRANLKEKPEGNFWSPFCYANKQMRDIELDKVCIGNVQQFKCDGVYLDGFGPIMSCDNGLHGCNGPAWQVEAYIDFCDRWREFAKSQPDLEPLLWGHSSMSAYGVLGLSDITFPGEIFVAPWVPNSAELESFFTSLLNGWQVLYCSNRGNGGPDVEQVGTYETALSRCSVVYAGKEITDAWMKNQHDYMGLRLWQRYMLPLGIYDINTSQVHHVFDEDFATYAEMPGQGACEVLYHRPGDVLLIAVRELVEPADQAVARINVSALGFKGDKVWVVDTNPEAITVELQTAEAGILDLGRIDVMGGPQIFRLLDAKDAAPAVVWHNQTVWDVVAIEQGQTLALKVTGLPQSDGLVYVACAERGQPQVQGGELICFDQQSSLATIQLVFGSEVSTQVVLRW